MSFPPVLPHIAALPTSVPFVGPETMERRRGRAFRARIGANENVFGPSPKAIAAMDAATRLVWHYGDPTNGDLIDALAAKFHVSTGNIVVGEGIDGLLALTVRTLVGIGAPVVTSRGAYPTFNFLVESAGGRLVTVPYRDDREDLPALIDTARREKAPLVYLANPDNPMGTWWTGAEIAEAIRDLPDETLLVLDEAYAEFGPDNAQLPIDTARGNVLHFRTFSKAYGMAGARIGYAIGHAGLLAEFEKVRNHYGVNKVAQAGALAALGDDAHLAHVIDEVARARIRITDMALGLGLKPVPSATSFVTVDMGGDGVHARALLQRLIDRDIFVRMPWVAPQDRCIRFGCGTAAELDLLAEVLPQVL